MNVVYREIDPDHGDEAYQFNLFHEYAFFDPEGTLPPDTPEGRAEKTRNIVETIRKGEGKYFCLAAFVDGKMVGSHFLARKEVDRRPACHVHGLFVLPEFRHRGIARELKARGELWAKSKGCAFMDTTVDVRNAPMLAMNERLGYAVARVNLRKLL
ncbi:MAG: GNAT family N-acetyltransferase [Bdellovibrionales bacterium]|nr:GNAT family N-acetyltransferase [Bdellovibrionales bacterium]